MRYEVLVFAILALGVSCAELSSEQQKEKPTPTINPIVVAEKPLDDSKCEIENKQLKEELDGLRERLYSLTCDCDCGVYDGESSFDF